MRYESGTDRHLDIQHIVERMEGVECLDLEEMVKEAQAKGIKTEFVGWNEDHTEGRCKNDELSIYFQPDGVIRFNGKDVILEIKTESTYQFSNRYEPKADHKWQATCYGMGLGIDYILFFYEDRNFCKKKPYLWKITDEMKQAVLNKIRTVNNACKTGIPPEKDDILVGKDGARYFEDIVIYKQDEQPALLSSIAILRADRKKIIPEFLYYTLKTPAVKKNVRDNYGSGSAIPRIVLKDFKRMPFSFPSVDEQRKITAICSAIDSKIQVNNAINKNLAA